MESALSFFLQANLALVALLFLMVSGRKVRRDRREVQVRTRRDALRTALVLGGDDLDRLRGRRRSRFTIDLAVVLQEAADRDDTAALTAAQRMSERNGFDQLLRRRLRSRRPVTRGTSALLLGHLRSEDADLWLRPLLSDPDGDVKLVAAAALARCGSPRAATSLVTALEQRSMPPERLIERLGAPWAAPTVLHRLSTMAPGADDELRCCLVRALGLAAHRPAEPYLLQLLVEDSTEVRVSAARALATCGSSASVPFLRYLLLDATWEVQAQAAMAVGLLGCVDSVPALERTLSSPAWWVRSNAASALAALGDAGVDALRRAADGADTYAAERAKEELARLDHLGPGGVAAA